ncbi:MAG: MFS transporter [Betaproteobacteria bacterium]|nr:MFS transporter [Betaproteobacteria bacterium]
MNDNPTVKPAPLRWRDSMLIYLSPASLRMLTLGFAAGLPLLLVLGTLSFRLREAGIDRATIGFLSWVGLAYGFKWAWAPLVDRLPLPLLTAWLGRRRSWLLVAQGCVIAGLLGMAMSNPQQSLTPLVGFALLTAFGSATQDIALDAFRIESAQARLQAVLAASYQTGYRLAMIWAGAGVFWIAAKAEASGLPAGTYQDQAWAVAYVAMALSMAVGMVTVLFSKEPAPVALPPAHNLREWLQVAVVEPFSEFIRRYRWHAVLLLALIGTYRISDIVMGIMANPFYVDMGYTKEEVAMVTKLYGVVMTLVGAFVGGSMVLRWGVMRVLMLGAVLSAATNLLFAWLALHGHDVYMLIAVVSADNLGSGIASAAFIAYLSSLTNVQYSATQYALFSSLMLLAPKLLAGFSGLAVDAAGYAWFFTGTALLGVPVLGLVWLASRLHVEGDTA